MSRNASVATTAMLALWTFLEREGYSTDYIFLQVSVDGNEWWNDGSDLVVTIEYRNKSIARFTVARNMADPKNKDLLEGCLGDMFQKHLNLATVKAFSKLDPHFPGRIRNITATRDQNRHVNLLTILFKNGHKFTVDEADVGSEVTIARGIMVYDLPNL